MDDDQRPYRIISTTSNSSSRSCSRCRREAPSTSTATLQARPLHIEALWSFRLRALLLTATDLKANYDLSPSGSGYVTGDGDLIPKEKLKDYLVERSEG